VIFIHRKFCDGPILILTFNEISKTNYDQQRYRLKSVLDGLKFYKGALLDFGYNNTL
jgi:penicillin-binding protein-related factor A (putative recombinase)